MLNRLLQPGFYFDASRQRYIQVLASGKTRAVSQALINRDVTRFARYTRSEMSSLTAQLVNGEITQDVWYTQMRTMMRVSYRQSVTIANGGLETMTPSHWGSFGAEMKKQYQYLDNFRAEIMSGKQALDGRAVTRAGMYGDANYAQYQNWKLKQEVKAGYELEGRRVLHPAEHCGDCVTYAALGWVPIDQVPPIGASRCLTHCKCTIETRKVKTKAKGKQQ